MPSMYIENNCSAEELIEFADNLNSVIKDNCTISFSKKQKEYIRDYGPAFIIYLTKYKKIDDNTVNELLKLVDIYIKPFFSDKEVTEFICCSQIYLYHVVNSIKTIDKNYVIPGFEACLIKNVDSKTEFYKYLYKKISHKNYVPRCKNHYNKFFINNTKNTNLPVCFSCNNKVCYGAGCKVKAYEPSIGKKKCTKPIYTQMYQSTKKKESEECDNNELDDDEILDNCYTNKNKFENIKIYLNKINQILNNEHQEKPNKNDIKFIKLLCIIVSTSVISFFIFSSLSFRHNKYGNRRFYRYESQSFIEKIIAICIKPISFFLN